MVFLFSDTQVMHWARVLHRDKVALHDDSGALAREARAAEHHGQENAVNYPSDKFVTHRTPTARPSVRTTRIPTQNFG